MSRPLTVFKFEREEVKKRRARGVTREEKREWRGGERGRGEQGRAFMEAPRYVLIIPILAFRVSPQNPVVPQVLTGRTFTLSRPRQVLGPDSRAY